ncbi:MAG TPA: hypothetical protein VNL71_10095 [Chloroflexota bacterium]|nr:hypothetical protein [Chloroflexota bacterium]
MRKVVPWVGVIIVGYIGLSLLVVGWNKHSQDGGSHLDLFIGGAVFAAIALAGLAQATGMIPGPKRKTPTR